jgi:hypothetical protein
MKLHRQAHVVYKRQYHIHNDKEEACEALVE